MARRARTWALAAFALLAAGCAGAAGGPLPGYLFSLTAWTAGRDVEFLLLNVTDRPVRASRRIVETLSLEVRDEAGEPVSDGFVRFDETPRTPSAREARRLASQAVFREKLAAEALVRRIEAATGAPLDRAGRYRLQFEAQTPVVGADGQVVFARVRSRSNCVLLFERGRAQVSCGSG